MGFYYDEPSKKAILYDKWRDAQRRLEAFKKALRAPVGSFEWEDAVHSDDTIESLRAAAEKARKEYEDCKA